MKKVGCLSAFVGYLLGIATLGGLILIFGDYDEPETAQVSPSVAVTVQTPSDPAIVPTETPVPAGLTFDDVCDVSRRNLTQPQLQAHARSFEGQTFTGWPVYVYDVQVRRDSYRLLLSVNDQDRAIIWTRSIEIDDIPEDLATRLNVNQLVTLSGRIESVGMSFDVMCNPMIVTDWQLQE